MSEVFPAPRSPNTPLPGSSKERNEKKESEERSITSAADRHDAIAFFPHPLSTLPPSSASN